MSDPITPEGRTAIRERAKLAQKAVDHINDVTFDGRSPSTAAWQSIAESQADVPALLDALDQAESQAREARSVAKRMIAEADRNLIRADDAEDTLESIRDYAAEQRNQAQTYHNAAMSHMGRVHDHVAATIERILSGRESA